MKKISLLLAIILSIILILSGCSGAKNSAEMMDAVVPNGAPAASAEPEKPMEDNYYAGGVKGDYGAVDGGADIYNNSNNNHPISRFFVVKYRHNALFYANLGKGYGRCFYIGFGSTASDEGF